MTQRASTRRVLPRVRPLQRSLKHRSLRPEGACSEELDRKIAHHRLNLEQCPEEDVERADLLRDLATALRELFRQCGGMDDLEEAITCTLRAE